MRKIAIFSDIHSNLEALEAIINDIKDNKIDEVICLGDILAMGPNPKECLDLIFTNNIKLLLGNHELYYIYGTIIDDEMSENEKKHQEWVVSNLNNSYKDKLLECELKYKIFESNLKICFQHFFIDSNSDGQYPFYGIKILKDGEVNKILENNEFDINFYGHEHKGFEINDKNKINIGIGSSGCTKDGNTFYTILEIDNNNFSVDKRYIKYDRELFENKIINSNYPEVENISEIFFGMNNKKI